ncbi:hypothetical protein C4D60_Mb04t29930 [Musa balbisiana]|uniref:YABBY N-terminal domain-containing protein n=1 Tax=Musa balbisiana TaxID=52838 RepID=A0A4S8KFM5_MUSBA|nr:hypothetical protein C4D60_Mb04t29930 [Musa balbisiana]
MSAQVLPEHICYVHCNFCNTVLAGDTIQLESKAKVLFLVRSKVSVPGNSSFNNVAVRCGHCSNLLSVNMGDLLQRLPFQDFQWAHFPHIQFGLTVDGNKQPKTDEQVAATVTAPGSQKAQSFF